MAWAATALEVSSPAIADVHARALASLGDYGGALAVVHDDGLRAEVLRRAGRSDDARALLATLPADTQRDTRAWLAMAIGAMEEARDHAQRLAPHDRHAAAEIMGWWQVAHSENADAVRILRDALRDAPPRRAARMHVVLGAALEGSEALDAYQHAHTLARLGGQRHLEASAQANLGRTYLALGQLGPALEAMTAAARSLLLIGQGRDIGRALFNLAQLEMRIGQVGAARTHLERALRAARSAGDRRAEENVRVSFAELDARRGELGSARALASSLTFDESKQLLAYAVGGAAPELARGLLAACAERPVTIRARIAETRLRRLEGPVDERALTQLAESANTWEDALDVALFASDMPGPTGLAAMERARTLLDLATASLDPERRELLRSEPAHSRVLTAAVPSKERVARDRSQGLLRAARRLAATRSIAALYEELARSALALVDAERACVARRGAEGKVVVLAECGEVRGDSGLSRTVLARALDGGAPVSAMDALSDESFGSESVHTLALRSLYCVPLGGRTLAVLYVEDRMRRAAFDESDARVLGELAALAEAMHETIGAGARAERARVRKYKIYLEWLRERPK